MIAKTIPQAYQLFAAHQHEISLILMNGCVPDNDYNTGDLLADFRLAYAGDIIATSGSDREQQLADGCNLNGGKTKFETISIVQKKLNLPVPTQTEIAEMFAVLPTPSESAKRPGIQPATS